MEPNRTANGITEGVIWKQLLLFFFPIMLGTLFQQMYNMVDTIVVGQFVSTQALAAVGASAPLVRLITGFFIGVSSGATVVLSLRYGAGDRQGIRDTIHTGMALALVGGLLATVIGVAVTPGVLRLIETPESCLNESILYTCIYFSGSVVSMVYNMGAGLLRAMGDSRRPMIFLIIACVINIVLDIVCVVFLQLGVAGAGIATVLSQAIAAVLVVRVLMRLPEEERLEPKHIRFRKSLLVSMLRIGIPCGLQYVLFDVSNLIIQSSINSFGDVTMAAWTAFGKADTLVWMVSGAFGVAITTFVGQNFGAQQYRRVRQSVWVCMAMCVSTACILGWGMVLFRFPILSLFTPDPAVIQVGAQMALFLATFDFLYMPVEVFSGAMRGTGYSLVPTVITAVCACVVRVLWVKLIVGRWHTLFALCMAYPVTWVLASVVFFLVYLQGDWMRRRIRIMGMVPEER